ncbi:hypothetical protein F4819DRAFT_503397 [Hypoxylon fuscum]|nr:hypothetical protein F4819DRAFT_503397 [Hypoxylon fuscum]
MRILKTLLPKSGMIYSLEKDILGHRDRDAKVLNALATTYSLGFGSRSKDKVCQESIDSILAGMFASVRSNQDLMAKLRGEPLEFLSVLRITTAWGQLVNDSPFFQMVKCLLNARRTWIADPRPPFDQLQHCRTARAIDEFLALAGTNWGVAEFTLYDLVGGWEEDGEEDQEMNTEEDEEINAEVDEEMGLEETRSAIEAMDIGDEMEIDS